MTTPGPGAQPQTTERARVESLLRDRITTGTYQTGAQIPSMEALASELGVGKDSVQFAFNRLSDAGLLLLVEGRGTVVTDPQAPPTGPELHVTTLAGTTETWTVPGRGITNADHIRTVLTRRLARGTYPPGERVPSTRSLAEEFRVSQITLRNALKPLIEAGLLIPFQGRGTFANSRPPSVKH